MTSFKREENTGCVCELVSGEWRFETLDRCVATAEQHHVEVLLVLGLTPQWASARPGEKSGRSQYVDIIGYHFYVTPNPPEAMVPLIRKVRQVTVEHGAGAKPLWNTETGWAHPKRFPPVGQLADDAG